ncbi:MAG TPA: CopD family protein [Acetobacteraceae bacterium]|nr:CopD family protein [Acetobacteraceae bacterium]
MSWFDVLLTGFRSLHMAAMLSLLGVTVFSAAVLPAALNIEPSATGALHRRLLRLSRFSGVLALLSGVCWLVAQAAAIAGSHTLADLASAVPVVALHTRFGQSALVRLALLAAALPLLSLRGGRNVAAAVLTGAALALQGWMGHAGAAGGIEAVWLVTSEALHLIASGVWLGGLLPLLLSLSLLGPKTLTAMLGRFSQVGIAAVATIAATAVPQGLALIGNVPSLVGTAYGQAALLKLALFLLALTLAARNRLVLTGRVLGPNPGAARRALRHSIGGEAVLGLIIIGAAGFMASSVPGLHQEPAWPFSWRFSLDALQDPGLQYELTTAALSAAAGIAAVVACLIWRRGVVVAVLFAAGLIVTRLSSFALLLVPAYPTSFFSSPTGFAAASIVHGQRLFAENCAPCHGAGGRGDGPAASSLPIHPADLTAPHVWMHMDGELFWWIGHGIEGPEGGLVMPAFADQLQASDRWDLIDFIHAMNAGTSIKTRGTWPQPIPAPSLPMSCADGANEMQDLRGKAVYVIAEDEAQHAPPSIPAQNGIPVVTFALTRAPPSGRPSLGCVAATEAAWPAFAVLAGVSADRLGGTGFLIDPNGWLRAVLPAEPDADPGATDRLIAEVRDICAHPILADNGGGHEHHHH